ncbi:G3E family GTPase [Lachnospiraceae bacterium PF1-21]|uniref:CobW family GTP-binding protein n=1 Tax=Ohessyouella blattaphilus TaxID=2949333 RepID=UPI003E23F606
MTKVDIISGFLGAGKTTYIKQLIEKVYQGEKLVLIENEFGEIGIDGGFLKDSGIEVTEMNSGCICCTLVGDFSKSLLEVLDKYHPDRVIIEPSGVGKLSDVVGAVKDVQKEADIVIENKIAVVDGKKAKLYLKNFGEFFVNQVENADVIVVSRTQDLSDEKLEACINLLREHNKEAAIITTPWDELTKEAILNTAKKPEDLLAEHEHHHHEHHHHEHEEGCSCGHHHEHEHHHEHGEGCSCGCGHDHHEHNHHHHDADEVFTSWGQETPHKYDLDELEAVLKTLANTQTYGQVLRAKGIVAGADGVWKEFDLVPEEYEIRDGKADYTGRICVIGTDLKEDELKKIFHV